MSTVYKYFGTNDEYTDKSKGFFIVLRQITRSNSSKFLHLTSKGLRWLKSIFCFPKTDLVQALTTSNDTMLIDAIGVRDEVPKEGGVFVFDGNTNSITTGIYDKTEKSIYFKTKFIGKTGTTNRLIVIEAVNGSPTNRVFQLLVNSANLLYLGVWDELGTYKIITPLTIIDGKFYDIVVTVNIRDIELIVNDVTYTQTLFADLRIGNNTYQYIGGSPVSLLGWLFDSKILNYTYSQNGVNTTCNCEQEVVYNTNEILTNTIGVTNTVAGTLTNFFDTDNIDNPSQANTVGYGYDSANPTVVIPLDANGIPTATYTEIRAGRVKYNTPFVGGGTFTNDNSTNVVDITADFPIVPSNTGWSFGCIFKPRLGSVQSFGYSARIMYILDNKLQFRNSAGTYFDSSILINEDRYYTLFCTYGLDGSQKYFDTWLDGIYRGRTNITTDAYRFLNSLMAQQTGTNAVKEIACTFLSQPPITGDDALNWKGNKINGGSDEILIPFVQGSGTTVADVNNNVDYTVSGTTTNIWDNTQDEYFYAQNEGFTDDGTNYIPASQLNAGEDVLGNTLTNPAIEIGLNGGVAVKQYVSPEMVLADTWYKWFNPAYTQTVHSDFNDGTVDGWFTAGDVTISNESNTLKVVSNPATSTNNQIRYTKTLVSGNTYRIIMKVSNLVGRERLRLYNGSDYIDVDDLYNGIYSVDLEMVNNYSLFLFRFDNVSEVSFNIDEIYVLDLSDQIPVTAKVVEFEDIENNYEEQDYAYANIVDASNQKQQLLTYALPQSIANQTKIDKCYLKSNTLPDGMDWLTDEDGNYLIDSEGEYIYG